MMKKIVATLTVLYILVSSIFAEIPAGYYISADKLRGKELLYALNMICSDGDFLKYGSGEGFTWQGFYFTDRDENGVVIDMYSDNTRYQSTYEAVDGMHIEHSFPKSWWGGLENYAYRDLHHLFPADDITNITKNNLPLGIVGEATFDNGISKVGKNVFPGSDGKCFEPADEYKGDFARAYFYMAAIYNELSDVWQSPMLETDNCMVWEKWALDLLLEWHHNDPVSQKELDRQEKVYSIQYNRNPFIDYPELVDYIWGDKTDTDFIFPTEYRPYLVSPDKRTSITIPATAVGSTEKTSLIFKGNNLTSPLYIKLKNNAAGIKLSKNIFTSEEVKNSSVLTVEITSNVIKSIIDTLVVSSTGITDLNIPIEVNFTDQFMVTAIDDINPVSATIKWMKHTEAEKYRITIQHGQQPNAPDLFFSGYVEGNSYNKAVAIYNGMGENVDLSRYSIKKQSNGTGNFSNEYKLSGTLAHGDIFVISHNLANYEIKQYADVSTNNNEYDIMSFNGNDALALYHNNILIDVIGVTDNSAMWGADITLRRKSEINAPSTHFNLNEWEQLSINDITPLQSHSVDKFENDNSPILFTHKNCIFTADNLIPDKCYTVYVTAMTKSGKEIKTVNSILFRTSQLNTPEAYEATDIFNDRFKANWEPVPYAEGYIVNLYSTKGNQEKTYSEGFDNVTSTGTQLPEDWTGNVSGNYTSTASSGESIPSVAFKNDNEWLLTPEHELPISRISFMYRFVSAVEGSYISVYVIDDTGTEKKIDEVKYADGSKHIQTYDKDKLGNNVVAIKIVYHKKKGNLALDDFSITTGGTEQIKQQTIYTTATSHIFDGLKSEASYCYEVLAVSYYKTNDETKSLPSNIVAAETNNIIFTENSRFNDKKIKIYTHNTTLEIINIENHATIDIFDIAGKKVKSCSTSGHTVNITLPSQGIYIVNISQKDKHMSVYKLLLK